MKRLGKKLLIGSLLTLVFMGSVSAKSLSEGNLYTKNWDSNLAKTTVGENHYISISDVSITNMPAGMHADTYKLIPYYVYDAEDSMTAYCADPHLASYNNYEVERILGTSDDETVKKVDLGILEILKNGHHNYKGESESDKSEYMATSIALRAFLIVVGGDSRIKVGSLGEGSFLGILSAHANIGLEWADSLGYTNGITTPSWSKDKYVFGTGSSVSTGGSSSSDNTTKYEYVYVCSKDYCPYYNGDKNGCLNVAGCSYKSQGGGVCYSTSDSTTGNCGGDRREYTLNGNKCIRKSTNKCESGWKQDGVEAVKTATSTSQSIKATQLSTVAYGKSNSTSSVLARAKELFALGYNAYQNGGSTPTITSKDSKTNGQVTITIKYDNFTANQGKIVIGDLSCYGGTCANKIVSGDINANGVVTKSSGTIKITFKIPSGENCSNINYTLKYTYDDPNLKYVGAYLVAKNGTNGQNLYAIQDKGDDAIEAEITGRIICGDACKTEIEEPVCSTNEEDAVATIKTNTDVKKCILDNEDDAGNTYQFTSNTGGVDNDYCQVFCKEDYDRIQLNPVVTDIKCGTYFKLTSQVQGKKTCYAAGKTATKQIDKKQFIEDIGKAQEEMINAYNEYIKWQTAYTVKPSEDRSTYYNKTEGTSCSKDDEGNEICVPVCRKSYSCLHFYVDGTATGYHYKLDKTTGIATVNYGKKLPYSYSDDGGSDGECNNGSCESGTERKLKSNIETNYLKPAKDRLNKAIETYNGIISNYNLCTTGWKNEFAFKQELKFYYDENHGDTNYTPYYDLIKDTDKNKLEKDGEETSNATITVCKGNTTNSYECISGEKPVSSSADNGSLGTYNYNSAYGDVFTLKNYIKCSQTDGCFVDKESYVSDALFVKKEVEKKQDYITPTAYYQIAANGKITIVSPEEYTGNKVQLEALENSLPISTSSVGGGVFRLMISNLGEFYDQKSAYGRLIDYGGDKQKNSVVEAIGSTKFDGNYKCHYENPCRPKDCPNCNFTCEGDGCSWEVCSGDACDVKCVGCIFNLDELTITHKTISTTNFNSAGRAFGYNWITSSSMPALNLLTQKAGTTITEIEEKNETIYDNTKEGEGSELAFSIKLTPDVIATIKKYNEDHIEDGGYINDSLTCYDATTKDGKTYENIYCYSELIDELMEKYDNIIEVNNRIEKNDSKRKTETDSSGYWTLWDGYVYKEGVLGGPSWK